MVHVLALTQQASVWLQVCTYHYLLISMHMEGVGAVLALMYNFQNLGTRSNLSGMRRASE